MLLQNDPLFDYFFRGPSDLGRTNAMPMDAYRRGDNVWVHVDLPGVSPDSIDIDVERSVLTISAERNWQREEGDAMYLSERNRGTFRRQVHLGDNLDTDGIEADFADGVLTLRLPISAKAKPKKIPIGVSSDSSPAIDVESTPST